MISLSIQNQRCSTTRQNPTKLLRMDAKNKILALVLSLWAVHSYHFSPLFGIQDRRHRSAFVVQAFSDGMPSRRRHFSSRSLAAKHGAIQLERTFALSNRPAHPALHTCKGLSLLDISCKSNFFPNVNALLKTRTRCDGRSSVLCRSTITDEITGPKVKGGVSVSLINGVNGLNGHSSNVSTSVNGDNNNVSTSVSVDNNVSTSVNSQQLDNNTNTSLEIPTPTANGGYSHTTSSRAKISAANKGKTAWNKGKARSEETKARIAEGVRRRNRERFLAKLAEEGITEEEHDQRKKETRRKKDAERRARRTAKGGYTPTEETKQKISKILKEKYASGEVKRKPRDPSKVRRGFRHSEETKQRIRESLRRKWAEDSEYRELMTNKTVASGHVDASVRQRISESLKKKWEDPEFRASMLDKFSKRKAKPAKRNEEHRQKISAAMKKKWMDEEYRKRATDGMAKGRKRDMGKVKMAKLVQPKMPMKGSTDSSNIMSVQSLKPMSPVNVRTSVKKTKTSSSTTAKKKRKKAAPKRKSSNSAGVGATAVKVAQPITSSSKKNLPKKEEVPELPDDGSIMRLREERRDLYDLLYGDEEEDGDGDATNGMKNGRLNGEPKKILTTGMMKGVSSNTMAVLLGDDDDLDDFDPYGLHDTAPSSESKRA